MTQRMQRRFRRLQGNRFAKPLASDLTWDVTLEPVISGGTVAENYRAIHRNDNNVRLNIVKKSYQPLYNKRLREIVINIQKHTGLTLHGYSEFGNGAVVTAYLKNNEPVKICGIDTTNYMVVGSAFDYSRPLFNGIANCVHRCTNEYSKINMLTAIRHNKQMDIRIEELERYYADFNKNQLAMKEEFEIWEGIKMTPELKEMFADNVLEIDPLKHSTIKQNQKADLFRSINLEIAALGDNLWGAFNGVTHYTTHVRQAKERVFGNVVGPLANINKRAHEAAVEILALVN